MTATFDFDGRPIPFRDGQSIGAALIAAGVLSWRSTRMNGRPRGIFCGIGVCFDCMITVDGRPNVQACLEPAGERLDVRRQDGSGHGDLTA